MSKSFAMFGAILIALLFSHSSQAEEQEIRSTGGAYLGKYKFEVVDPADALLSFPLAGRTLESVSAGLIANTAYREVWQFQNSFLIYDRLPAGKAYKAGRFNEGNAPIRFCGKAIEQNCDVQDSNKLSRNLIIVKYIQRRTGNTCAGLHYLNQDRNTGNSARVYGNYSVVANTCLRVGNDFDEAVALSAHYLSLIKKDDRQVANLARYDLPKPKSSALQQSAARPDDGEAQLQLLVDYKWEGITEQSSGALTASNVGSEGAMSVKLGSDVGDCTGKWQRKGDKPDTADGSYGVWYMSCDNGLAASGSYEMTSAQHGAGEGRDTDGRLVEFSIGQ